MAVIYREITGTVKNSQGELLSAGTLKVKPRGPIIQGSSFIAPRMASVAIADGEFTLSLAAPSIYEFLVISDTGETLWNFQSPLESNTSKPISLAELWTNRNATIDPEEPYEITRVSGDTYNLRLWLVDPDTGAALDLNAAISVVLTVDEREEPDDESTVVFQLPGAVIDPDKGVVDFTITANQADTVGEFFYNVTVDYDPEIGTVATGPFNMVQNINQALGDFLWTADGSSAVDGSGGVYYMQRHVNDAYAYDVRGGTPILRCTFAEADDSGFRYLVPDWPMIDLRRDVRISFLVYMDESWYSNITISGTGFNCYHLLTFENEPGFRAVAVGGYWPNADQIIAYGGTSSPTLSLVPGWVGVKYEWDSTLMRWSARMWNEANGEHDTWDVVTEAGEEKLPYSWSQPGRFQLGVFSFGVANVEVAWMRLEFLT